MSDGIKAYYEDLEEQQYRERVAKIETVLRNKDVGQFMKEWDNLVEALDKLHKADLLLTRYQHRLLDDARESARKLFI
jgi:hypothetical protein